MESLQIPQAFAHDGCPYPATEEVRFAADGSSSQYVVPSAQLKRCVGLLLTLAGKAEKAAALAPTTATLWFANLLERLGRFEGKLVWCEKPGTTPGPGSVIYTVSGGCSPLQQAALRCLLPAPSVAPRDPAFTVALSHIVQAATELAEMEAAVVTAMSRTQDAERSQLTPLHSPRESVEMRVSLLQAAGWLPVPCDDGGAYVPVGPGGCVSRELGSALQVLAMDDAEFWAFRSVCDFFVRRPPASLQACDGHMSGWEPVTGPSFVVTQAAAKGGKVTVHGGPAGSGVGGSSDEDTDSGEEAVQPAAKRTRGRTKRRAPKAPSKGQEGAATAASRPQPRVRQALGGVDPEVALRLNLLRVEAPIVPLPQPWLSRAQQREAPSTVASHRLEWPAQMSELVLQLKSDPASCAAALQVSRLLQMLPIAERKAAPARTPSPVPAASSGTAAAAAPSFAFSIALPGASATPAAATVAADSPAPSQEAGEDFEETGSDMERDEIHALKQFVQGESDGDDVEGDVREGAYVLWHRALQMQAAQLADAEVVKTVKLTSLTRAAGAGDAVKAGITSAFNTLDTALRMEEAALADAIMRLDPLVQGTTDSDSEIEDEKSGTGVGAQAAAGLGPARSSAVVGGVKRRR